MENKDVDFKMVIGWIAADGLIHLTHYTSPDDAIEFLNTKPHDEIIFFCPQTEGAFEMAQHMLSEIQVPLWQACGNDLTEKEAMSLVLAGSIMIEAGFVLCDLGETDTGLWAKFMRVAIVTGSIVDIAEQLAAKFTHKEIVLDEETETVQVLREHIHSAYSGFNEDVSASNIQVVIRIDQDAEKTEKDVLMSLQSVRDISFDYVTPPRTWSAEESRYVLMYP